MSSKSVALLMRMSSKHSHLKRGTILPTIMIITEKGKNKLSRLSTSVM